MMEEPRDAPLPGLTRHQAREVDRIAVGDFGMSTLVLMENAGLLAGLRCAALRRGSGPVLILCGAGSNGGDGLVIARQLALRGLPTRVVMSKEPVPGDCGVQLEILRRAGHSVEIGPEAGGDFGFDGTAVPSLVVDAMLGTGFVGGGTAATGTGIDGATGALRGVPARLLARLAERMDGSGVPVVALDLPSGMDCDTAAIASGCLRADRTLTFAARKRAFDVPEARAWTGPVEVLPIGCPAEVIDRARRGPQFPGPR